MQDEPLTTAERRALDQLPKEMSASSGLEEKVVSSLRASGRLTRRSRAWTWQVAAGLAIFLAGFGAARLPWPGSTGPAEGDQYLILLYGAPTATPDEETRRVAEYGAWAQQEAAAGRLVAAEKLASSYILLGPPAGGPANPAEPAGYFVIRAATASDAAFAAERIPHLGHGGTIVVRPIQRLN